MTVIAWDGRFLAADKRAVCSGAHFTTTKIRRVVVADWVYLLGWTGDQDSGTMAADWFIDGANPKKWPDCQKDKDSWSRLIVIDRNGAKFYERQPIATKVEDLFCAWGSGRDFALAALHLGKSAREAVEIASLFDTGCGNGIDLLSI